MTRYKSLHEVQKGGESGQNGQVHKRGHVSGLCWLCYITEKKYAGFIVL